MMAYAQVYDCNRLMLLYPHHHEVATQEGMVEIHQIANKQDFLIGIATVDLLDPKKVRSVLKDLLLSEGTAFDLSNIRFDFGRPAVGVA
jgi:5-methylcytosine-specific restriction enzyme subunit McrC